MPDLADDLALALRLADAADAQSIARFRAADLRIDTKPDRTPVTDGDTAVERAIREVLAAERPDDAILGEEYGGERAPGRQWIVDPIDGTTNFLRGLPIWATLIALAVDGEPVLGIASAPALGRRWWAATEHGAWASALPDGEPERLRTSGVRSLDDAFVSYVSMQGSALRDAAVHACFTAGFTPRVVQEAPDTHTVVALVGASVGVALMPASAETLQIEGVVFTPIAGGVDVRVPIALAWRQGDTSPVLANFLATAEEVLPSPAP